VKARAIDLLPILVCAFALGSSASATYIGVILAAIATTLICVGPRWELDLGRQWVTSAAAAGMGWVMVAALRESLGVPLVGGALGEAWTRFAAAMLLAAAARFLMIDPRGGRVATTALAFVSLTASGRTSSALYAVFVVLFLATSLGALSRNDDASPAAKLRPRRVAVGSAVVLVAAGLGLGTIYGVRRGHAWLTRAHSTAYVWHPRAGFSDRMVLGALDGLLDSDRVVLRVRGPRVDYLRGVSLDRYGSGRWERSDDAEIETGATRGGLLLSTEVVEVAAVSIRTDRFFLPLATRSLVTVPPAVRVDTFGSVRRETKQGIPVARFVRGTRDGAAIAGPRGFDLHYLEECVMSSRLSRVHGRSVRPRPAKSSTPSSAGS